jgi:hypothetical protein
MSYYLIAGTSSSGLEDTNQTPGGILLGMGVRGLGDTGSVSGGSSMASSRTSSAGKRVADHIKERFECILRDGSL